MNFIHKYEYLLISVMVTLVFIGAMFDCEFTYKDTDNYMRALRIIHDVNLGSWPETVFPMSNYPFGEVLHWTRLMDVLWLIMAFPLLFLMDFRDAVFYAGMYFSPVCAIGVAIAFVYALKPFTSLLVRWIVCGLFFMQSTVYGVLAWGRPDHHSLLLLLSILVIGSILRFFKENQVKHMVIAAVSCGLMVWTAAEGFLFAGIILTALAVVWITTSKQDYLPVLQTFLFYLLLAISLFWLIDPPMQGYGFADNGRLSVLQIFIVAFGTLTTLVLGMLGLRSSKTKVLAILVSGVILSALVLLIFGEKVLISPIDGHLYEIWAKRVSELRSVSSAADFFGFALIPITSIVVLYYLIKHKALDKNILIFMAFPLVMYTIFTFYAVRFGIYAVTFAFFPTAFFIQLRLDKSDFYTNKKAPIPNDVMAFVFSLFIASVLCPNAATLISMNRDEIANAPLFRNKAQNANLNLLEGKSNISRLYPYLYGRDGAVLTDVFLGPAVMWKFARPVIGTPYHRNVEGISDAYDIFFATDMNKVKDLLLKHNITDIFLTVPHDKKYYVEPEKNTDKLYARLYTGKGLPLWLKEVKGLNFENKAGFVLYRVNLP